MILRIVKMTFEEEKIADFLSIFGESREKIRAFPGCTHLELWQGKDAPNIFFTYSHWENEEALEEYRHSELFQATWSRTKRLFADKPEAWSVERMTNFD